MYTITQLIVNQQASGLLDILLQNQKKLFHNLVMNNTLWVNTNLLLIVSGIVSLSFRETGRIILFGGGIGNRLENWHHNELY